MDQGKAESRLNFSVAVCGLNTHSGSVNSICANGKDAKMATLQSQQISLEILVSFKYLFVKYRVHTHNFPMFLKGR